MTRPHTEPPVLRLRFGSLLAIFGCALAWLGFIAWHWG